MTRIPGMISPHQGIINPAAHTPSAEKQRMVALKIKIRRSIAVTMKKESWKQRLSWEMRLTVWEL